MSQRLPKPGEWEYPPEWVQVGEYGYVLHRVSTPGVFDDDMAVRTWRGGSVLCREGVDYSHPGVFSRLGAPRCRRCCRLGGYAYGSGTPQNEAARAKHA